MCTTNVDTQSVVFSFKHVYVICPICCLKVKQLNFSQTEIS